MTFFIDLKVAFDSVDRRIFVETMREKGIRMGLIERVEEMLEKTSCKIKVGRGGGNKEAVLDRKKSKTGLSTESLTVQHFNCGYGREARKS